MVRRLLPVICLLAAGSLSGCTSLLALEVLLSGPEFTTKPATVSAELPQFHVGDTYRYKRGNTFIEEKVLQVNGHEVTWQDNQGQTWVTDAGTLLPPKEIQTAQTRLVRTSIESTGDLYPLHIGRTAAFRYKQTSAAGQPPADHSQNCLVDAFGTIRTAAGFFDAFRMICEYDGDTRTNFYAPKIGRVVLQTSNDLFSTTTRELVGYDRGGGAPMVAKAMTAKQDAMVPKPAAAGKAPEAMAAKETFGIQLAAYKSAKQAERAWERIKARSEAKKGKPLLDDVKPIVERHEKGKQAIYRLIAGSFATKDQARTRCDALKKQGIDCWARAVAPQGPFPGGASAAKAMMNVSMAERPLTNSP